MTRRLIAATALALMASVAYAQTTTTTPAPAEPAPAQTANPPAEVVKADGYLASNIIGETVYNSAAENAENIGEVDDIVLDANGAATSLIVSVGGFLGVGERNVAVDFKTAKWAEKDGDRWLVIEASKEQLEAMQPFDPAPYGPAPAPAVAPTATTPPATEAPKPAN